MIASLYRPMPEIKNPQLFQMADTCVACGLCVPQCPSYQVLQNEADSPRGRIALMRGVLEGQIQPTARFAEHLDLCLTCRSCEKACPNQVPYGRLVDGMRAELLRLSPQRLPRWKQAGLRWLSRRPDAWRGLLTPLRWPGGVKLAARLLRQPRAGLQEMAGRSRPGRWLARYPAIGAQRGEVQLFLGCVARTLDVAAINAAIQLLTRLGFAVQVPAGQQCCGALLRHAGDAVAADGLVQRNAKVFAGDAPIVVLASGCGADLRDAEFGERVVDVGDFLDRHGDWSRVRLRPLAQRIAVHDPCSLRNVLRCEQAYYRLLRRIPQADIVPLPGNQQCCGAAGAYHLQQPQVAGQLRDVKIAAIRALQPERLVSANFGCGMWLNAALPDSLRFEHPLVLLAQQTEETRPC